MATNGRFGSESAPPHNFDLSLNEVTANSVFDEFGNAGRRAVCAVCRTESVVYINVAKGREFLGERRIVLGFTCVETDIFEKNGLRRL